MKVKKGQYISDSKGKKYELLEDASQKENRSDGSMIYMVKRVRDVDSGQEYFLKFLYKNGNKIFKYLQRESGFRFYYPYIEHVICDFDGKDEEGRNIYCVLLEHIKGRNLKEYQKEQWARLAEGVLAEDEFEQMMFRQMMQLLYGVDYYTRFSNADPYLHRDLEPDNIMITERGSVVIVDFDNAHISGSTGTVPIRCTWNVGGTSGYMDPYSYQQLRRNKLAVDVQSEIYAIGRVFFFWLNGRDYYNDQETDEWVYCYDEKLAFGLDENRFQEKYLTGRYDKLIGMIRKMCAKRDKRYKDVSQIKKDMQKFMIEFCGNSMLKYVRYMGFHEMPLLHKRLDRDQENAPNVVYQMFEIDSMEKEHLESGAGHILYNYSMRDIFIEDKLVMMIYHLEGSIYYIPYAADLVPLKDSDGFIIDNGDEFITEDKKIRFIINWKRTAADQTEEV